MPVANLHCVAVCVHAARHRNDIELEERLMKSLAKRIAGLGLVVLLLGIYPHSRRSEMRLRRQVQLPLPRLPRRR